MAVMDFSDQIQRIIPTLNFIHLIGVDSAIGRQIFVLMWESSQPIIIIIYL